MNQDWDREKAYSPSVGIIDYPSEKACNVCENDISFTELKRSKEENVTLFLILCDWS